MKFSHIIRAKEASLLTAGLLAGLILTGCRGRSNEPEPGPQDKGSSSPYEAIVEINSDIIIPNQQQDEEFPFFAPRRVHLGPDNTTVAGGITDILWSEGDEIICWSSTELLFAPYRLTSGANTTNARFQGKAVDIRDTVNGQMARYIDCAIYPASAVQSFLSNGYNAGSTLTFPDMLSTNTYFLRPSAQLYHEPNTVDGVECPTFAPEYNIMTGRCYSATPGTMYFQSAGGILLLRIKGSSFLSKLTGMKLVSGKTDDKLWGCFQAAITEGGVPDVTYVGGTKSGFAGDNTLTLDCSDAFGTALPTDKFTNFYFVLPYGVLSEGFTIYLNTDDDGLYDDGEITTKKDNTIVRSEMKVMPALELTDNIKLSWSLDDLYEQGTVTEF